MFRCVSGSIEKAHPEALKTAGTALGFTFKAFYATLPRSVVIIGIDYLKTKACGISAALLLANEILLIGVDVGIAVVYGGNVIVCQHPLNDGSAARGTTGM